MICCFAHADGGSARFMVGEAHACCLSCCDMLFCVRCMSGTTCFVVIFCADFMGSGVTWSAVSCACLIDCSFVHSPVLCLYGSCCFLLL